MAENEILDLTSRRWQRTRAALARSDLSVGAMAECAADNLQSVLQKKLADAFRAGQPLLMVFQVVDPYSAAMRAAVSMFQDQHLARITREAAKAATTKDAASVARCATDMLVDGLIDKALMFARRNGCFEDSGRLDALRSALVQEFFLRRESLAQVIEASLNGQRVREYKPVIKDRIPMTVSALAGLSIGLPNRQRSAHVQPSC